MLALLGLLPFGALNGASRHVKIDWNKELPYTYGGSTTLKEQMKGHDGLLLDFWKTTCPCCLGSMEVLDEYDNALPANSIKVVAINTDDMRRAEQIRIEKGSYVPWTYADDDDYYFTVFDIEQVPSAILLTKEGNILFQGHPRDPELKDVLEKWTGVDLDVSTEAGHE